MQIKTIPVNNVTFFTEGEQTRLAWHIWKFFHCGCIQKTPGQYSLLKYAVNSGAVGHKAVKSRRSENTYIMHNVKVQKNSVFVPHYVIYFLVESLIFYF